MAFDYSYVLNPTGEVDNHILREMFEDISLYLNNIAAGSIVGTINAGSANRLAYYTSAGNTIDDLAAITASRALASDANGLPTASVTTATELSYLSGVTSAIQTQLNSKTEAGAVTASDVDSEAATDGYVLTADGVGGAAWEDIFSVADVANKFLSNLNATGTAINVSLLPALPDIHSLGGMESAWRFAYVSDYIVFTTDQGVNTYNLRYPDGGTASGSFTLPSGGGSPGYILSTDGFGVTSWIANTDISGKADTDLGNLTTTAVNVSLLPAGTTQDIGTDSVPWRDIYLKGRVRLQDTIPGSAGNVVTIYPSDSMSATSWNLKLPPTAGSNTHVLMTDGSGNTSWESITTAGGASAALDNLVTTQVNADIVPDTDNTHNLGGIGGTWNKLYLGGGIYTTADALLATGTEIGYLNGVTSAIQTQLNGKQASLGYTAANAALSNLASVAINTSLISDTNNTDDLGSNSIRWRTGYFGTSLAVGGDSIYKLVSTAGSLNTQEVLLALNPGAANDRAWNFIGGKNADSEWGNYSLRIMPYNGGSTGDLVLASGGGRLRLGRGRAASADAATGFTNVMTINSGEVIPGSDNSISCGSASLRWSDVRATLINGSDYGFANGWILREYPATFKDVQTKDEKWFRANANLGLQFVNDEGKVVMVIGRDGTLYTDSVKKLTDLDKTINDKNIPSEADLEYEVNRRKEIKGENENGDSKFTS